MESPIICQNLTRKFGTKVAIDNLSFIVHSGEIFGIMGPNGAGKTTTLRIISGILKPTSGSCSITGYDVYKNGDEIKKISGLLPETSGIYQSLTAREFLYFIGTLYSLEKARIKQKIEFYFDFLEFSDENIAIADLSRGQRQKIMFMTAMIHDPKILLLDEPIATLDPLIAFKLKQHILELATEKVILLSSHNPQLIQELSTRVLFISKGKKIALDKPEKLMSTFNAKNIESSYLNAIRGN